jgi:hypothetical protein
MSISVRRTKGFKGPLGIFDVSKIGLPTIPNTDSNIAATCGPLGTALLYGLVASWASTSCAAAIANTQPSSENEAISGTTTDDPDVEVKSWGDGEISEAMQAEESLLLSSEHKSSQYSEAKMNVAYETNKHILHVPIAGSSEDLIGVTPGSLPAAVNIQVSRPTTVKKATFRHQRFREYPSVPAGNDMGVSGSEGKNIEKRIEVETPELWKDGTNYVYGISGELRFGMVNETDESVTQLDGGKLPYDASQVASNKVPTSRSTDSLLDYANE